MSFYPFFIECSLTERNETFKRKFKNLAFGIGGLIYSRGNSHYLSFGNEEFLVPTVYNEKDKIRLTSLLKPNDEFNEFATQIYQQQQRSGTMKKMDKLKIISDNVLGKYDDVKKFQKIHVCILLIVLLNLTNFFT